MSGSFRQSTMVVRCRCTAARSSVMTLESEFNATYRMLLSRFNRNLPKIFTASTFKLESLSTSMMV